MSYGFEKKKKDYPEELHIKHWFDQNGLSHYEVVGGKYPHAVKYVKVETTGKHNNRLTAKDVIKDIKDMNKLMINSLDIECNEIDERMRDAKNKNRRKLREIKMKNVSIKYPLKNKFGGAYVRVSPIDDSIDFTFKLEEATVFKNEKYTLNVIGEIEHWGGIPNDCQIESVVVPAYRKYISEKSRVAKAGIQMSKSLIETCHLLYLNDNCMEYLNGLIKPLQIEFDRRLKNGGKHK